MSVNNAQSLYNTYSGQLQNAFSNNPQLAQDVNQALGQLPKQDVTKSLDYLSQNYQKVKQVWDQTKESAIWFSIFCILIIIALLYFIVVKSKENLGTWVRL